VAAEVPSSRWRVRAAVVAALLVVVMLVAGGSWAVARGGLLRRSAAPPATAGMPTGLATVTRTDVVARQQVAGTLSYGASSTVVVQAQAQAQGGAADGSSGAGGGQPQGGILTCVPAVGTVVGRGQELYEVDGHAVPLWYGTRPAWRAFQLGMSDGPDVRELEANLVALGFDPDRAITVDQHFSWVTALASKRWQLAIGRSRTGAVPLGQVVFLPGPIRVTTVTATVGAPVGAGTAILTATSTRPRVTVALDPAVQQLVRRGDRVLVTLPDGATIPGTVTTVGRVAVQPSTGTGQDGQGQDQGANGNGSEPATIQVTVRLANLRSAANLDQAPVQVAITTEAHKGVLAVPISALLAQPGGGYAVELVEGASHRRIVVRTGLFDETAGLVEVQGAGLAEGTKVEVPAP